VGETMTTTLRGVKPIKVGELHRRAERYRDGFVKLFREVEGAQVLTDDGEPLTDARGRVFITAAWFAREMGIGKSTFHYWLEGRPSPVSPEDVDESSHSEQTFTCSCIPDPGCPIHGEGVNHGSPLENRYA
jgi:hypothetical protein